METDTNDNSSNGAQIAVDIPLQDSRLFRGKAADDILLYLARHHNESFSMTGIAEAVNYTRPTITKAVDCLSNNDLVVEERDGSRRLVQINRNRLTIPDSPYLQIPQSEFHAPVEAATEALIEELNGVLAVVLYGSVSHGEADRRSDIDIWVLVRENRMSNQRRANQVRKSLEENTFDGNRYAFDIDVEGLQAVPNYVEDLREILQNSIVTHRTGGFDTIYSMILHGSVNE
ncbi:nucleotidyltransferase domain-containing protein [Halogeometricum sp. S1BR25-6]|uniref:Nucleotidyltransferase domain-containing protein n=1 Tax=Halogeometricum salsisoli TaxID=2950536 RepID=A0ABU2G9R0_9EURY|nr:nucleotidyltransferase domain-containing protein [Halogeometricum sp. S1BR25-6]MDS0297525.1 nucleotidyltransferase domain-containing protein [Halogeometricum sp. S1BR25-6]